MALEEEREKFGEKFRNKFKILEDPKAVEHRLIELGMNLKEFGMRATVTNGEKILLKLFLKEIFLN